MNIKTLIIDNYDSFTNNLYQYIANINQELPIVVKNDEYSLRELISLDFDNIIISPGPGRPDIVGDFGICTEVLHNVDVPILGVCLGHQGIGSAFGGEVIHAPHPIHGQLYKIRHNNDVLFKNIPDEFEVIRYHSLIINNNTLPQCLEITAQTDTNLIMGLKHRYKPIWGLQFHPESINTKYGYKILENFMQTTEPKIKSSRNSDLNLNRPLSKPSCRGKLRGDSDRRTGVYTQVHEDSSTESTKQVASAAGFGKRSNEKPCRASNVKEYTFRYQKIDYLYNSEKAFKHLFSDASDAIWLDSNHQESEMSRFSILACLGGPHSYKVEYDVGSQLIKLKQPVGDTFLSMTIFDFLQVQLDKTKVTVRDDLPFGFKCGFVGYFGYELYRDTLNILTNSVSENPDAQFIFIDRAIVFDHEDGSTYLIALHDENTLNDVDRWFDVIKKLLDESLKTTSLKMQKKSNRELIFQKDKNQYITDIKKCLNYINDGDSYEICLTNKANYNKQVNPLHYYSVLRTLNPAPYSAYLKFNNLSICSSSMERFLVIDSEGNVETRPIKGTLPRGDSLKHDLQLIEELRSQRKFLSENLMIVDLLRHDLGGVCDIGTVQVDKLMDVESYASVHQLVSRISGKLRKDLSVIDCIKAVFPGGSIVGAPKKRTIKIIDSIENESRGIYSGAIGYLSLDGNVNLNIVIRTAVITPEKLSIGVGGAIIALSDPEEEYNETLLKLKLLKTALSYV